MTPKADGAFDNPPALLQELADHRQVKFYSGLDNPAVQNGFGHTPCVGILWLTTVSATNCTAKNRSYP